MYQTLDTDTTVKKENFFQRRLRNYRVLTFTISFLFLFRLTSTIASYLTERDALYEGMKHDVALFMIVILAVYFIAWLIVTWVASKFTHDQLREKFYKHPVATMLTVVGFIVDLPLRLVHADFNGGILVSTVDAFEIIIYYAFASFVWWLFFCWISKKIFKKQKYQWNWYKRLVDKAFVFIPLLYKLFLGLMVALTIFILLFVLLTHVFHYTGADLQKL